jgi:hypothetical protein
MAGFLASVDPANIAAIELLIVLSRLKQRLSEERFEPAVAGLLTFAAEWNATARQDVATVQDAAGDALWWRAKVGRGSIASRSGQRYVTACEAILNLALKANVACLNADCFDCFDDVQRCLGGTLKDQPIACLASIVEACIISPNPVPWADYPGLRALFSIKGQWGKRDYRAGVLAAAEKLRGEFDIDLDLLRAEMTLELAGAEERRAKPPASTFAPSRPRPRGRQRN